jgi:hypothetical protein
MVAERQAGHAGADRGHDPGAFMTEHDWSRVLPTARKDQAASHLPISASQ